MLIIDRFQGNFAVVEDSETDSVTNIDKALIDEAAKEGDVLSFEDGAYIGMRASIIARTPVTIGEGAIVGACSLVNKNVDAGRTVVGIPAKVLYAGNINRGGVNNYYTAA